MDCDRIKELMELIQGTDVIELSVESDDEKVTIRRSDPAMAVSQAVVQHPNVHGAPADMAASANTDGLVAEIGTNGFEVTSPFVGTFYRSPSPDSPPFVEDGASVKKGQTLCLIEAMKLMNEIEADFDARVVKILIENGEPVEYGQRLFILERV